MNAAARDYPPGDLRVSDADRDRALAELTEAFQVGRITAEEFDQRSGQVLRARTGHELTAPLEDLPPLDSAPATRPDPRNPGIVVTRGVLGASAVTAAALTAVAVSDALSRAHHSGIQDYGLKRRIAEQVLHHVGVSVTLPAHSPASAIPGFDWVGTITPAAIGAVLVALIVVLFVAGHGRRRTGRVRHRT